MNFPHSDFSHSESWKIDCLHGGVEVKRWKRKEIPGITQSGEGLYVWNVYAYISWLHPLFASIKEGFPDTSCVVNFPMHKGANYIEPLYTFNQAKLTGYKVGCDYNYTADEWLTHISSPQAAESVFRDALRLRDWLNEKVK